MGNVVTYDYDAEGRMPYYVYLPKQYRVNPSKRRKLLVLIHSSGREPLSYIEAFRNFSDEKDMIILAPLFTEDCTNPVWEGNYKFIIYNQYRFDEIVLKMIETISAIYHCEHEKFLMHGFSGGGQYVHRFFYLHPDRLRAVSIGAPGIITYLDEEKEWYEGIRDFKKIFGQVPDFESMKRVQVQLIIGENDTDDTFLTGHDVYRERYGKNRYERLRRLKENYMQYGIAADFCVVSGVGHEGMHNDIICRVEEYLGKFA